MSNDATFRHVIFFVIALWLVEKQPVVRGLHARYGECAYSSKTQSGGIKPEVYWINLNTSHSRRKAMTKFLDDFGLPHFRIEAVTKNDIFIPEDLWNASLNCRMSTSFEPSYVATTTGASTPDDMFIVPSKTGIKKTKQSSRQYPRKIYIKGLCGRNFNHVSADNNRRKELAVTVSHLMAIRQAVYSTTATSRYALILEDDVWTPFDIRLEQLAEEVRKETGSSFGIIQFLNSKRASVDELYFCYKRKRLYHCEVHYKTSRWAPRLPAEQGRSLLTWSTGAYLIDRVVMKPVIDQLITQTFRGWTAVSVIAARSPPCYPAGCCTNTSTGPATSLPCVYAPVGLQADSFIYATVPTYVLTTPLFLNSSRTSTVHQEHVTYIHNNAFNRIHDIIQELYNPNVTLPVYFSRACNSTSKL